MMPSAKTTLALTSISAVLLAIILSQPIGQLIFNLLSTLVAVIIGSLCGVFIFALFLDYIEEHQNLQSIQSDAGIIGQYIPPNRNHQDTHWRFNVIFNARVWFNWLCNKARTFALKVSSRLLSSPVLREQLDEFSAHSSSSHSSSIYETIRPLGQTPDELLTSAYGPTAFVQSSSAVCVSQNVDEVMQRIFEYTFRDFVETWYSKVSSDHGKFHKILQADYWDVVKESSERLSKLDTVNLIMNRFVRTVYHHMEELKLTAKKDPDDVKPAFSLHPCLRDHNTEIAYLRHICDYILILTLPPETARITSLRYILREVLAGLAFLPMVETLCEPDYINQTILSYFDRRNASQEEQSRVYAYAATYEEFIKIINERKSLSVLRQIRYRIMTEIIHATTISSLKKDRSKAGKARSLDKGELLINRDLKRYINQCQMAKQQCEKKIRLLGGEDYGVRYTSGDGKSGLVESQLLSFEEIMNSPIARSYFLKYLRKIGKASLLKFWNETEMIKTANPSGKELAKIVAHLFQSHVLPGSSEQLSFDIEKTVVQGMQDCVMGNKKPVDFYTVQKQVYDILEKDHYPSFVVSDIYTCQLVPEVSDQHVYEEVVPSGIDMSKAAFGEHSTDGLIKKLRRTEEKLEYKAQALESLRLTSKVDLKVIDQLEREIGSLQESKWRQQLHMERTNAWWDQIGKWNAAIEKVHLPESEGAATPVYTIIVQCSGVPFYETTDDVSGWVLIRSLHEFHQLHHNLKDCSPWLKKVNLPKLPMFRLKGLSDKFLAESKAALDEFLHNILQDETLRCSQIVYSFLSPGPDVPEREVKPSSSSRLAGNIGGFFKRIPQDFVDIVMKQLADADEEEGDGLADEEIDGSNAKDSVAEPLYMLISEIFELHGLFRLLRRSLITFVRVAFGRSINRQVRETSEWLVSEPMIVFYLTTFLDSMWPDGKLAKQAEKRTEDEKVHTKLELQVKILQNIPEALNGLVGQENAKRGVLKVFHSLQDKRLNKHLFYNLLDETMEELFPEIIGNDFSGSSE